MAFITAYSWIFSMIILNHGIITVSSFGFGGLFELGANLLMDKLSLQSSNSDINDLDDDEPEGMSIEEIGEQIDDMEEAIMKSETRIITKLGHLIKYQSAIRDFSKAVTYINHIFELFKIYADGYENETLRDLAELCVTAGDNGLTYKLHDLMETVSPSLKHTTSLFRLALGPYITAAGAAERCNEKRSVQQELSKIYEEVWLYIIKGYSMISHAYALLQKLDHKKFKKEKKLTNVSYNRTMRQITKSALSTLRIASRDIRSCDPKYGQESGTYIELKWLFNGFLIPEKLLSTRTMPYNQICSKNCEDFTSPYFKRVRPYQTYNSGRCYGNLHNCFTTDAQHYCAGTGSGRRYDYVTHMKPIKPTCDTVPVEKNFPRQFIEWDSQYICEFCTCACDDYNHPETVRSFSLASVKADTRRNMVITGLRLVEINRAIYIEIQQGQLEANGSVKISTVDWKSTAESKEFWTVHWNNKSVNLDTLAAPAGHVMTGIKFKFLKGSLKLSIRYHEYNYEEGFYRRNKYNWTENDETDRWIIELDKLDTPIKADKENTVALGRDRYINFTMTDWGKNLSQTAIPFLDAQEVISAPPQPLSGAGLYFRGQEKYGGFIGLKLVSYDYIEVLTRQEFFKAEQLESGEESEEDLDRESEEYADGESEEDIYDETGYEANDIQSNESEDEATGREFIKAAFEEAGDMMGHTKKKPKKNRQHIQKKGRKRDRKHNRKRTRGSKHTRRNEHIHRNRHIRTKRLKMGKLTHKHG